MVPTERSTADPLALLDAQLDLWGNTFGYIKSMALKTALDLRIADAIHHHGGAATLSQIAAHATLHASKTPCLGRLMRVLTVTGVFSAVDLQPQQELVDGEATFALTPASRLLVGTPNLVPITTMLLHPLFVTSFLQLGGWFQHDAQDPSIFERAHGEALWNLAGRDASFDALINDAMVSDSLFLMDIAIRESSEVFQGITSLVDVAGGHGAAAQAISRAFPLMECTVMDLGHVVATAPTGTNVQYVAGDMFHSVPPADAVFLKWVLHDWGHQECVKILRNCREAIPSRDAGGKVIIMDIVVGAAGPSNGKHGETMQALFDLYMIIVNGTERDEQQWKEIFIDAGFTEYKIIPVLGFRSIIEVYP